MRWLVLLLLLANGGYAGWYHLAGKAQEPAAVVRSPAPDNLERLRLLEGPPPSEKPAEMIAPKVHFP